MKSLLLVVQLLGIAAVFYGVFLLVCLGLALIINGVVLTVVAVLLELAATRKDNLNGVRRPVSIR